MKKLSKLFPLILIIMATLLCLSFAACEKEEVRGEEITITVSVTNKAGETKVDEIKTTATNLGDALVESGIVEDNQDKYGLYILTVYGETADYNIDKSYWSLTKNGEYLMSGASDTKISDGDKYELVYTVD